MRDGIAVHATFEADWPFAVDAFAEAWTTPDDVWVVRLALGDDRPLEAVFPPGVAGSLRRLAVFGVRHDAESLAAFSALAQLTLDGASSPYSAELAKRSIRLFHHPDESYWAASVAEFALALALSSLRSVAHWHCQLATEPTRWRTPAGGPGHPAHALAGTQCVDDLGRVNGTMRGKQVRVAGLGHIGSRFAQFARALGADVAAWDPVAAETTFALAGARRVGRLVDLVSDADIVAPILPHNAATTGLLSAAVIHAMPPGSLLLLVTRAAVCDMAAVRKRVVAGELALAADVFDQEPLDPGDPLLGLPHVVHTPHVAGRTRDANVAWGRQLAARCPLTDEDSWTLPQTL